MSSKILASIGRHSFVLEGGCREGCPYKLTRGRQSTSMTSSAAVKFHQQQTSNPPVGMVAFAPVPSWEDVFRSARTLPVPVYTRSQPAMSFHLPLQMDKKSPSDWRVADPLKFLEDETNGKSLWMASVAALSPNRSGASVMVDASVQKEQKDEPQKPNMDQLRRLHDVITNSLSKLFSQPMDYSVYHPEIVFVDNIRNKTFQGLLKYVQQVALLRAVGHFKFAYVKFDVLNTSISLDESRITVRWRIRGISGLRVMLKFWRIKLWDWKDVMSQQENWYDGISHFDIGSDCLVHRHIADKVMEDKDRDVDVAKHTGKTALAAKLGVLAALFPNPSLTFFSKPDPHTYEMESRGLELHK